MGLREAELLVFPSVTALLRRGAGWLTGGGGVSDLSLMFRARPVEAAAPRKRSGDALLR